MTHKIIEKIVPLHPSLLNENLRTSLFSLANDMFINKCTKDDGYIVSIESIDKIVDNYVSPADSNIIFKLRLNATVIKPEIGQELRGTSTLILNSGIFVMVDSRLKVLIPTKQIVGYEFDKVANVYKNSTTGHAISIGSDITFFITNIRYEKNKFSCIGKLNEPREIDE